MVEWLWVGHWWWIGDVVGCGLVMVWWWMGSGLVWIGGVIGGGLQVWLVVLFLMDWWCGWW